MNSSKEQRRQELYSLLGDLPDRDRPISVVRNIGEEDRGTYILEKFVLDLNGIEDVPAYFVKPKGVEGPSPAVLFNHSHGGYYHLGKNELIYGNRYLAKPPHAEALAAQGYAVLCIDHWGFGERSGKTESSIFKEMLWKGQVMWGMMVYDNLRALDYLASRDDVDPTRVATLGLSMGSTMSWWTAALDTRIKVCVDICCLTDFDALIEEGGLDGHGIYYYVPRLMKHFTTSEINALIAPRAHLGLAGNLDSLTPVAGLDRVDAELSQVYADEGAPDAWKMLRYDVGHEETDIMRREIMQFLQERL